MHEAGDRAIKRRLPNQLSLFSGGEEKVRSTNQNEAFRVISDQLQCTSEPSTIASSRAPKSI